MGHTRTCSFVMHGGTVGAGADRSAVGGRLDAVAVQPGRLHLARTFGVRARPPYMKVALTVAALRPFDVRLGNPVVVAATAGRDLRTLTRR